MWWLGLSLIAENVNESWASQAKEMFKDYHTYGIWVHGCVQQLGYNSTNSNLNFTMIIAITIIGLYATCDFFRHAREVGTQTSPKKFGGIPFYDWCL